MKRMGLWAALAAAAAAVAVWAQTQQVGMQVSVASMPPVVVATVPRAGDTQADPNLAEIRVTFSKEMMTEAMWSWAMVSAETFPRITGQARFLEDRRTCAAPVKLEPGRAYAVWFNTGDLKAFRDTGNRPAVPYLLVFETAQAKPIGPPGEGN